MYLWRRLATRQWWRQHQDFFAANFGEKLAVIERTDRKRLQIEVICNSPRALEKLGGRANKLPRDWLKQTLRKQKAKPLKIGNRLVISRSGGLQTAVYGKSAAGTPPLLVIPAEAAFGTGEHATTKMSLRLLEEVSRKLKRGWPMVDLGTGSGILALAARCLGAKRALGIDIDPMAISTAKANARRNKIDQVQFRVADVRRWKFPRKIDIVAANLFSELLIEILPQLRRARRLILSGILREQEGDLLRALRRCKIDIVKVQRRGKWIAIAARVG
jgi:ribosomal protein L11 methyltransferase